MESAVLALVLCCELLRGANHAARTTDVIAAVVVSG